MTGNVARIPPSRQREKPGRAFRWIGQNMKRVEDPRLLAGQGRYIDDVAVPGMLHAAALRSPHAHARIKSIDVSRARALPGVAAVMTGADVAKVTGAMPCFANPPVEQRCVAQGRVRHVGEPVAIVAAESRYIAEDALELIEVDYEALPAVVDPEAALSARGDAVLHPERGSTNVAMHRKFAFGPVDEDFANAASSRCTSTARCTTTWGGRSPPRWACRRTSSTSCPCSPAAASAASCSCTRCR
jgi:CO/xanthine dehydrogenase Mo-binding subunit